MNSKELKFLLTHSSIYGIGTVVAKLVAFILLPLYTRYLTPTDYGILELIDITSVIIGIVVTVGIAWALSRFYYEFEEERERNRVVSTAYITYSIIACCFVPILFFLSAPLSQILLNTSQYGYYYFLGFLILVIGGLIDIGLMYLRLIKKPVVFITITITRLILLISFNVLFIVYFKMGVIGILYSSLIVRSFYAIVITTSILWKIKVSFSLSLSRDMLKYSLPIIPSNMANRLVKYSDRYLILYFLSISNMGIYSLAAKIGTVVHYLITIPFNMAFIPRRFEIMNRKDAKETYAKIFTYYVFFISYIGLILSVIMPEIVEVFVTPEFYEAGQYVPLIIFSMLLLGSHYHFNFGILKSKKTKYMAYINITTAVINIGLNILLIGLYGIWGAIWSSVIVLGLQAFLLYIVSDKQYHIEFEFGRIFKYIFICGIFYSLSTQIDYDIFIVKITIKLSLLLLFLFTVILLKIVTPKETSIIKEVFKDKIKPFFLKKATNITQG